MFLFSVEKKICVLIYFQGGPYFEILTPQGKDSLAHWKQPSNGFKKVLKEKYVSSFAYLIRLK
jgi:hypothetical protein